MTLPQLQTNQRMQAAGKTDAAPPVPVVQQMEARDQLTERRGRHALQVVHDALQYGVRHVLGINIEDGKRVENVRQRLQVVAGSQSQPLTENEEESVFEPRLDTHFFVCNIQ